MTQAKSFRLFLSLFLTFSFLNLPLTQIGYAQTAAAQTQVSADLQARLAKIEEKLEARRKELGIPGVSLVIVKDDEIVYMKGLGYKDFAKQIPVTPDSQFAIGSASKAFTALSVLMSQDEGKLSLDDNPKKHLSYFKINDAEIDKTITIRDLLSHSSGLNRTDLGWISGKLSREEIIRVAGKAKPTAKLRERFQYQNVMFAAAGEIVAKVQKQPWEEFVPERIFKPLGMNNTTMSVKEMQKAKDYSLGYQYNFDTKETRNMPTRELMEIAPAGSINSSARDMAQWLRFVINKGELNGKRLISEKGFEEWTKPQMKISPNGKNSYGLGWFVQEWNNLKVVQHGGNIDGFNSIVAMIPEKKLGFVLLTNVSGSPLANELMLSVWENILGKPAAPKSNDTASVAAEKEIGKYRFEAAGLDIEIKMDNGKLVAVVPGQPTYVLENVGERKYKLSGAPEGFFITFREKDAYLEQPQGNYTLPKVSADASPVKAQTATNDSVKDLIGKYKTSDGNATVEIKEVNGKVSLVVGSQQPYELKEKEKDVYSAPPLPDSYSLKVKRDAGGKLSGIVLVQPEGEFPFNFMGAEKTEKPKISVDELMAKTIEALGGEVAMRKINSREMKFEIDFEHQGVKGFGTSYAKTPNLAAADSTLTALGKTIATSYEYFDGTTGGDWTSFSPADTFTGQRLEDVKYENDFYGLLNWKQGLKSSEITGTEKVGDEETYVVVLRPEKASEVTYYVSTKTFLPLKKKSLIVSSTSSQKTPITTTMSDYRPVDGVMLPFKTVSTNPGMGNVVTYVKEVKSNVTIDDKMFKAKK
jgi:CubicO group peptidase (beta-lactamase class C family)